MEWDELFHGHKLNQIGGFLSPVRMVFSMGPEYLTSSD